MEYNQELYELVIKWNRRIEYLEEVIKLEEKYYPEKIHVTDVVYARIDELKQIQLELQGVLNQMHLLNYDNTHTS